MKKLKKIFKRIVLILAILIPIASFAHFIFFPEQTRSILVDYSSFKKEGRLYFNAATPQNKLDSVKAFIVDARLRVANFWGQQKGNPKFIYCNTDEDFKKFGSPYPVPALTHMKGCSYIVLSNEGMDMDIIAHELSHAELYTRIGFYNWTVKIPRWFDEGLAMQNDYRNYYSEDTLKKITNNFKNLPDIKKMVTARQFDEGGYDAIKLHYMAAKHAVNLWYTKEKLNQFIKDINAGKSFDEAFVEQPKQ
jgi:hypothetical protein